MSSFTPQLAVLDRKDWGESDGFILMERRKRGPIQTVIVHGHARLARAVLLVKCVRRGDEMMELAPDRSGSGVKD